MSYRRTEKQLESIRGYKKYRERVHQIRKLVTKSRVKRSRISMEDNTEVKEQIEGDYIKPCGETEFEREGKTFLIRLKPIEIPEFAPWVGKNNGCLLKDLRSEF